MIDADISAAIVRVSYAHGLGATELMAFVETESNGQAFAMVDGRQEPLIRWEGHYFHRLIGAGLEGKARDALRKRAVEAKLASPKAGEIANPVLQQDRWDRLLRPAMGLDREAAIESCSWGLGQVMGAHWQRLGFASIKAFYDAVRSGIDGQVDVMARFVIASGLKGALMAHDWATVAAGYNGPGYKANRYDVTLARNYRRHTNPGEVDGVVMQIQERLVAHGFAVAVDGIRGPRTDVAILAFQKAAGLQPDGIVGRFTLAALDADPEPKAA